MKLDKKGFVATSVLYCLAALMAIVIFFIIANVRTIRDYTRISSKDIKEKLNGTVYNGYSMNEEVRLAIPGNDDASDVVIGNFYVVEDSDKTNPNLILLANFISNNQVTSSECSSYTHMSTKDGETETFKTLYNNNIAWSSIDYSTYRSFIKDLSKYDDFSSFNWWYDQNDYSIIYNGEYGTESDSEYAYCRPFITIKKSDFKIYRYSIASPSN